MLSTSIQPSRSLCVGLPRPVPPPLCQQKSSSLLLRNPKGEIAQAEVWPEMDDIGPLADNPEETTRQKNKG